MKEQIETLVNRLEAEINKTPTSELRSLLTDANVLLQALSIHVVINWVACKDKLPEFKENVLCWNEKEPDEPAFVSCLEKIVTDEKGTTTQWYNRQVSHWMPLPKPPCL